MVRVIKEQEMIRHSDRSHHASRPSYTSMMSHPSDMVLGYKPPTSEKKLNLQKCEGQCASYESTGSSRTPQD